MTERRIDLRAKILGSVAGAAIVLATVVGLSGTAQALTPGAPGSALSMHLTPAVPATQYSLAAGQAPAAATCLPAPNRVNRTQLCFKVPGVITVLLNKKPVGSAYFTITHYLHLNPRSRNYTEQVTIDGVRLVGKAGGIHIALADGCGATCTPVGNNFPVGDTLRSGLHGTLTFHDSVAAGHEQSLRNKYEWLAVKAGFGSSSATYFTPLFYRCDDMISSSAGCVFPEYTPTLTTMLQLPNIAANIHRIQSGGGHYGRIGSKHPLHHITDRNQQRRNNAVLCPASRPRPHGMQCDEYPFASTKEGGNGVPPNSHGWAWVPAAEQRSQGGRINSFYNANRVLNGDAFWVLA